MMRYNLTLKTGFIPPVTLAFYPDRSREEGSAFDRFTQKENDGRYQTLEDSLYRR
jgi:hypothetical protein